MVMYHMYTVSSILSILNHFFNFQNRCLQAIEKSTMFAAWMMIMFAALSSPKKGRANWHLCIGTYVLEDAFYTQLPIEITEGKTFLMCFYYLTKASTGTLRASALFSELSGNFKQVILGLLGACP